MFPTLFTEKVERSFNFRARHWCTREVIQKTGRGRGMAAPESKVILGLQFLIRQVLGYSQGVILRHGLDNNNAGFALI